MKLSPSCSKTTDSEPLQAMLLANQVGLGCVIAQTLRVRPPGMP